MPICKIIFFVYVFATFSVSCHKNISLDVFLEMVGQVETSLDWFGSVFVVNRNFPKAFTDMVIQSAARFVDIYIFFFAKGTGCVVDKIGRNAREMIGDGNKFLRSRNFVRV